MSAIYIYRLTKIVILCNALISTQCSALISIVRHMLP